MEINISNSDSAHLYLEWEMNSAVILSIGGHITCDVRRVTCMSNVAEINAIHPPIRPLRLFPKLK